MEIYVTKQGDMWDSIALAQLGDDRHTDKLLAVNRKLHDYYLFPAGVEINLPHINPDLPGALPPWKQVAG